MTRVALFVFFCILLCGSASHAANEDDRRVQYYFLRATLAGQSPFAKALAEFRKNHDEQHKPGLSASGLHPYHKAQDIIQNRPKSATGGSNAEILKDLSTLTLAAAPDSKKFLGTLAVYSIAYKALTSPPMYAPRHYEKLAMDSQEELDGLRNNVRFFVSQSNAGRLSADEQKSLDLLFNYYTGVSASLSNEAIMADPLMLPVKEADRLQTVLRGEVTAGLQALSKGHKLTQDLIRSLANEQGLKDGFKQKTDLIGQARNFQEIDKAVAELNKMTCAGATTATCQKGKSTVLELAENRKTQIARAEFQAGIEQGIELGLAISGLTGNENMGKAFRAIKAVNQAVQGVSGAIDSFNNASTAMGSFAAIAAATTFVIGAVVAIAVILATSGDDGANQAILAALQEIKSMIVDLSKQMEAGFDMLKFRTERLESLIESYGKLTSANLRVLQEDVQALSTDIRNGVQPLQFVEIVYRQQLFDQFKTLREGSHKISFALPPAPKTALTADTRKAVTDLFASLFAIVDAVKNGAYSTAVKGDDAVQRHFDVIRHLAGYLPSRFRSAFLLQNALNASGEVSCGSVNLIGYIMASEAAAELNLIVGKLSHYQLAELFADPTLNRDQFVQALRSGRDYLQGQRQAVAACVTSAFFTDFEKRQLTKILAFIDEQQARFFDADRINNMLLSLQKELAPPSGFRAGNFTVGKLITDTRSFEPLKWEKIALAPPVRPGFELGATGFRLGKDEFAKLVLTPEMRLAHVTGADVDYMVEDWWQLTGNAAYQFRLIMLSQMSKQLMHVWRGYVDPAKTSPLFQYLDATGAGRYRKFKADTLGELHQLLQKEPNGIAGAIAPHIGNPSWLAPGTVYRDYCADKNGYYDCGPHGEPNGKYDPLVFWRDNPYVLVRGVPQPVSPERLFFFSNEAAQNKFGADFSTGMVNHIGQLRNLTTRTLSPCLEALVQGEKCEMEGMPALYPARHRELLEIDNFNLIRATLDPGSAELQSVMQTVALSEIRVAPAEGKPDATIERIAVYRRKIVGRLSAIEEAKKAVTPGIELPAELSDLMENEYDWLEQRLAPFLSVQ